MFKLATLIARKLSLLLVINQRAVTNHE